MNQCLFTRKSPELQVFPHVVEFTLKKSGTIQFDSLKKESSGFLRLYYVLDGRFGWIINEKNYVLFPGDLAIVLPGQHFGGEKDFLDLGTVAWLHLDISPPEHKWSLFTENEWRTISRILFLNSSPVLSRFKDAGTIFQTLQNELQSQEIGYITRTNHLLHELLILTTRQLTQQNSSRRDFPQSFMKLEQTLRANLLHQWTVDEMAALMGLGATAFSEKVKSFTGFSPLHYLINIRISEAIRLLQQTENSVTDIALEVGFYSSQHFATTFKKLTGYTPSEFRKNNTDN